MKHLFLLLSIAFSLNVSAQSPFKHIPPPAKTYRVTLGASNEITAYRFTGPIAGYMYPQNQVVTGLGYGFQRLHYVDSTQRYYTDFSISAMAYAGGNVLPSLTPNNIMSVGISLGFLNQLVMFGPAYNLPTADKPKGSFGVVINISVPLN